MARSAPADGPQDRHDDPVVHKLKVGGKWYAVNLLWTDVEDQRNVATEARERAATPGIDSDTYAVRAASTQIGLGRKAYGQVKGMPSLAGRLADGNQGTWIGLFEIDGEPGFYLVAVNSDLISAQTDKYYADEMEAKTAFDEAREYADYERVYAPASLAIPDTESRDIRTLLTGKAPKLQSVDRVSAFVRYGTLAAVAALLLFGVNYYFQLQSDAEYQRQMDELAARARAMNPMVKQEKPPPPAPWDGAFKAASYIQACTAAMDKAVLSIPGWRSRSLVCDGHNSVQMTIDRQAPLGNGGGTMNWIRWSLDRHGMRGAAVSPASADQFLVTWEFPDPDRWKPDVGQTPTVSKVRYYLQSQLEEQFTAMTFGTPKQDDFFRTLDWAFPTSYDPKTFVKILDKLPGAVINKISLDLQTLSYKLEGQSYEQLPLPQKPKGPPGAPGAPLPRPGPTNVSSR